ncbi:20027_t:CDS:1, partial [Gigaspora rosea]
MNPKNFNLFLIFFSYLLTFTVLANAFNYKQKYAYGKPCKDCCKQPGSAGWKNDTRSASIEDAHTIPNTPTAELCCKKCLNDPKCIQWNFGKLPIQNNVDLSSVQCFIYYNNYPTDICQLVSKPKQVSAVNTVLYQGGIIRCGDE